LSLSFAKGSFVLISCRGEYFAVLPPRHAKRSTRQNTSGPSFHHEANEVNEANVMGDRESLQEARYPEMESSLLELKKKSPKNEQIFKAIIGFCSQKG
jgi:hypothetical protein